MNRYLFFAAFSAFLYGCPGSIDNPERFTIDGGSVPEGCSLSDIHADLIVPSCASTAGCHVESNSGGGLNLANNFDSLIDADASSTCSGETLIDSADPSNSLVYLKVIDPPPCGLIMPFTEGDGLNEDEAACVLQWVEQIAGGSQ